MKTKAWIIKNYDLFCLMNVDHNCGRENNGPPKIPMP